MGWREQMREGSFRGVPFYCDDHSLETGRRAVVHRFPLRDEPYVEDLGRDAREIEMDLYVLGDDYMAQRDRLLDALEAEGPGTLVHPWLGTTIAQVRRGSLREGWHRGGMASFSVRFVEAGKAPAPDMAQDTAAATDAAANDAQAQAIAAFGTVDTTGPEHVRTAMEEYADAAIGALQDAAKWVRDLEPEAMGTFVAECAGVSGALAALVTSPLEMAQRLYGLFTVLRSAVLTPYASMFMYLSFWQSISADNSGLPRMPSSGSTATSAQIAANASAVTSFMSSAAIIEASRASAGVAWESSTEALADRDALSDALSAEALTAGDDLYCSLVDLRAAVVTDVTSRGAQLPALSTLRLAETQPALLVAYRELGDATREAEIAARNPGTVRRPGFVPGGTPLEVLRG